MAGRPPIYNTAEELEKAIDEYFASIKDEGEPATITGLALYLGFADRQSLYDYQEKEQFSCIVKKARTMVECEYEKKLSAQSPTGAIFALKNMGWKDKSEVENSGNMALTWKEEKTYAAKPETN